MKNIWFDWLQGVAKGGRPMINLVNYWRLFFPPRLLDLPSKEINVFDETIDLGRQRVISRRRILWEKTLGCFSTFSNLSISENWKDWKGISENKRCENSFTRQDLCTTSKQWKEGETDIGSQVLLMPGSGPLAAATLGAMGRYSNSSPHQLP